MIGNRIEKVVEVAYAYREVDDIPQAYRERFSGRTKPWGTGQAILCCKDVVDSPFLVINADDYYGKQAYVEAYEYLTRETTSKDEICMVSFVLKNTLSDNGGVTRGVCKVNETDILQILWRRPILRNMRAEQPFTREKSTFQSILNPAFP